MFGRQVPRMLTVAFVVSLAANACAAAVQNSPGAADSATPATIANVTPTAGGGGMAATDAVTTTATVTGTLRQTAPDGTAQPATTDVYTDTAHGFSVEYPANFTVRTLPADQLAQFDPQPAAVVAFLNPETAASDVVETEPGDLEIRVYEASSAVNLDDWLTAHQVVPGVSGPRALFRGANITGVEVCAPTLGAPGCAYFVFDNLRVYQLTPATPEGEQMAASFTLLH